MKNSKLLLLLQTLEKKEMIRLESFLSSDYFNNDIEICRLFNFLSEYHPDFSSQQLNKEQVFRNIFPGQPYNDKQLRYLISKMNKLVEHFLSLQKIEQSPYQYQLALLEEVSRRGLGKSYRQIDRSLEKALKEQKGDSGEFFLAQFRWAEIKGQHFERQRLRRFDESIQTASEQLDRYYFLHRLRISCAMLDRQTILQAHYHLKLSSYWIHHLEEQNFFGEPIIRLYYTIFQALSDEKNEMYFNKLKEGIEENSRQIPFNDLRDIYLFAINYCARKIRQGKTIYVKEALNLYRSGIEQNILIEDGELSPWAFTNVVKLSLRMKQYDQIETFIEQYGPLLPEEFRENALNYNLAELYYYTGRFEQAQKRLHQVAYSDLNYYLGARVLLSKIYYETNTEEPLLALIASFTIFLKRNKELSNNLKHTYLNFCQLLFKIIRLPQAKIKKTCNQIQTTELLTDRAWLEKICREAMK